MKAKSPVIHRPQRTTATQVFKFPQRKGGESKINIIIGGLAPKMKFGNGNTRKCFLKAF